jgi:transposase
LLERLARLEWLLLEKDRRIAELERLLEQSRRCGKRQAAPFSKGWVKDRPKPRGRKSRTQYGRQATRPVPAKVDQHIVVGCALFCPHCDGEVMVTGKTDQYRRSFCGLAPSPGTSKSTLDAAPPAGGPPREGIGSRPSDAKEVGTVQLGPQLIATAAHIKKVEGLSCGGVSGLLERLFGVTVSRSGLARSLGRLAERGEPSYEILKAQMKAAPVVYPDETGWKIGGRNAWLHGATDGAAMTVYTIEVGRGYPEATELLGADYAGTIASDGWTPYRKFERASSQACLGHVVRRCHEMLVNRTSRGARTQSVLMMIARTARKRHLDGVRILADLLRSPHEIVHPALLIVSG